MWALQKPDIDTAKADVDDWASLNIIPNVEVQALKDFVELYDRQNGFVNEDQHDAIAQSTRDSIHRAYDEDGLMNESCTKRNNLKHVRRQLYDGLDKCPMCSIGQASDSLDHVLAKSRYKALSLCRLNLVPVCKTCNSKKSTSDHRNFIHAYYSGLPDAVFLKAGIRLESEHILISFSFDSTAVDDAICERLKSQWTKLDLDERLQKASISFLLEEYGSFDTVDAMRTFLQTDLRRKTHSLKQNDWRVAILRALVEDLESDDQEEFMRVFRLLKSNVKNHGR